MRYIPALFSLLVVVACNENQEKKEQPASQHSAAFNQSVDSVMNTYFSLSEAFVNWDSSAIPSKAALLETRLQQVPLSGITDSTRKNTASETLAHAVDASKGLQGNAGLEAKRHSFNDLTQNLYDLLRTVKYDTRALYLQECPMAFQEKGTGSWITDRGKDSIRNPYLGKYHPKYGDGMLECGENKSSIDF